MIVKDLVIEILNGAIENARRSGIQLDVSKQDLTIEHPQRSDHGDFATNLPLHSVWLVIGVMWISLFILSIAETFTKS